MTLNCIRVLDFVMIMASMVCYFYLTVHFDALSDMLFEAGGRRSWYYLQVLFQCITCIYVMVAIELMIEKRILHLAKDMLTAILLIAIAIDCAYQVFMAGYSLYNLSK